MQQTLRASAERPRQHSSRDIMMGSFAVVASVRDMLMGQETLG